MLLFGVGFSLAFIFGSIGKWFFAIIAVFITFALLVMFEKERERLRQNAERLAEALRKIERDTRNSDGYVHDIAQRALHYYDMEIAHEREARRRGRLDW